MKLLALLPFIIIMGLHSQMAIHFIKQTNIDTSPIQHVQDGLVSEWPDSSFQTDKETNIQYAADNDGQSLYVSMKIADFGMQMKMVRMGMNFYIDLKGRKKESRGVEFPIKRESESGFSGGGFNGGQRADQNQQGGPQGGFDKKAMQSRLALYLLSLKLFGFTDDEPTLQQLEKEGSVNIHYSWDDKDVMYLEYLIPLNILGDAASLNNKTISLGWKLNGIEMPSSSLTSPTTTVSSRPPGGGSRGSGAGGGGNFGSNAGSGQANMGKMMQEQSFWTKYTFH